LHPLRQASPPIDFARDDGLYVIACAGWDHNLIGLDSATGKVAWRQRLGHQFAFQPIVNKAGVFAVGFDIHAPEGYHLCHLNRKGEVLRRFPLFGLVDRKTSWANGSELRGPMPAFAVASDGSWVASAGSLGIVVWSLDGKTLWNKHWTDRQA